MNTVFRERVYEMLSLIERDTVITKRSEKGKTSVHERGRAVHFKIEGDIQIYPATIMVLNACNECFKRRHKEKYRLGVYKDTKEFHIDNVKDILFWTCEKRKYRKHYHYYRDPRDLLMSFWD